MLGHQEQRKGKRVKLLINETDLPSPLEFSNVCLMAEAKITMLNVVLIVCRGNI